MTATQCDFDFTRPPVNSEVDTLIEFLRRRGERWTTAKEVGRNLGFNERKVRQLAEHSDGIVISGPGCPGYRHINFCNADELREVSERLKSQAKAMLRRSIRLKTRAHALIS